jgi:hemin uptake protein HemP
MKACAILILVLGGALGACSTSKPIELPPATVQQMILDQEILQPGEKVKLITADGQRYDFRVTRVDTEQRVILGGSQSVPIDEVVALETKEFSLGKTALLAAGSYGVLALIAIAIAPALILGGG